MKKKICVIFGGESTEYEVSLRSAYSVIENLNKELYDIITVGIKKDGKWGSIDQYGNVVIEPTYTIKEGNNVDFIGRWHVCADKNANYYTDVNDVD